MAGRRLALLLAVLLGVTASSASAQEVRVMTFNIRYGTAADGENAWPLRRELVGETVQAFGPDLLGVQEALDFQLGELGELLPGYQRVGVGRDDGETKGEYSAILFRSDRLHLLDQGTFWFSDTPEVPGSMSWGNGIPRICTWARFRHRESGLTFALFNLHWDHQSQPSREAAARLLLERVREEVGAEELVIVTGDFNAGETNPAFRALVEAGGPRLRDSFRDLHPEATGVGTFHGFEGGVEGDKIDAVLVSPGWEVLEAGIDRGNLEGRYPSDHYPVTAVLTPRR